MTSTSTIPKNPGRRDLGMKVTLLFPDREIVEKSYVPIVYTACRTCYSEEPPEEIYRRAVAGDFDPVKMQKLISSVIESGHGMTGHAANIMVELDRSPSTPITAKATAVTAKAFLQKQGYTFRG